MSVDNDKDRYPDGSVETGFIAWFEDEETIKYLDKNDDVWDECYSD